MSRDVYSQEQRSPKPARRSETTGGTKQYRETASHSASARSGPVTGAYRNTSSPSQTRKSRHYGASRSSNTSPLTLPAETHVPHSISSSAFNVGQSYYGDEAGSPVMDSRSGGTGGGGTHRSRSATRGTMRSYHSLERDQDREFMPIREPRERSLDRADMSTRHSRTRERSLDRGYRERDERDHMSYRDVDPAMDSDPYREGGHVSRRGHSSSVPYNTESRHGGNYSSRGDNFLMDLQSRLSDLQSQYSSVKRELDATTQKLGSCMHSIKTFWSPELKKERALRKEEAAKYSMINDQLKVLRSENQKQAAMMRQLEEELRLSHMRNPDAEVQQHLEALYQDKDQMTKEIYLLRETIKELEMRIETQKQTLIARDESIKKLMEMLQNKGIGSKMLEEERIEMERLKTKLIETEGRSRHLENMLEVREKELTKELRMQEMSRTDMPGHSIILEAIIETKDARISTLESEIDMLEKEVIFIRDSQRFGSVSSLASQEQLWKSTEQQNKKQMDELRMELNKRDQEILAMGAKMKTLEEQHHDYQRHIAVLKESLCAKEEHYNMLQADVEELRQRLEEKNKLIEKKTQQTMTSSQDRNRLTQEIQELRDHMDIKDRKINVLQRKIENMEDLLKEKDNQIDMARARLSAMQAHHSSSEGALSSLEEAIGDKEKQISQLRDQRDRAEQERNEERDLHEREIAEYKMKMHALDNEMEKLQMRLEKSAGEKDRMEADIEKLRNQQQGKMPVQDVEVDALRKQLSEKEQHNKELEKKLKHRQDKLAKLESQLKQAEGGQKQDVSHQMSELQQKCTALEKLKEDSDKEIAKVKEDASRSQAELERLLQIMTASEEEKFALNSQIKELQESLKEKEAKLNSMKRNQQAEKTRSAQMLEEARHREGEMSKEASKQQDQIKNQKERIEELEEALKESVTITAEREVAVAQKDIIIKASEEKIIQLHAESRALQNTHNARCTNCPPMKVQLGEVNNKLKKLVAERKRHLEELFEMKQEALSAAVSEKDAHLALLEMSGIKNAQTAEEVDRLKTEKRRLLEKIKVENENRVKLLLELGEKVPDSNGKIEDTASINKARQDAEDGLRS